MHLWRRMRAVAISWMTQSWHMPAVELGCLLVRSQWRATLAMRGTGVFSCATRFASCSGHSRREGGCFFACRGQRQPQPAPDCGDARSARRSLASGWRTRWALWPVNRVMGNRQPFALVELCKWKSLTETPAMAFKSAFRMHCERYPRDLS
jgi:hypothetical protein